MWLGFEETKEWARWKEIKKSYDSTRKFQIEWATKMPCIEGLVAIGYFIHIVKCKIYFLIENKEKIVGYKWDTSTKHQGCKIAMWDLPQLGVKKGGMTLLKIVDTWRIWGCITNMPLDQF